MPVGSCPRVECTKVVDRIDVSNWRRIGVPEYELVEDMIRCANLLAGREDELGVADIS